MTLFAERKGGRQVAVRATYGQAVFEITEDASHLRTFWGQLGVILHKIESEQAELDLQKRTIRAFADGWKPDLMGYVPDQSVEFRNVSGGKDVTWEPGVFHGWVSGEPGMARVAHTGGGEMGVVSHEHMRPRQPALMLPHDVEVLKEEIKLLRNQTKNRMLTEGYGGSLDELARELPPVVRTSSQTGERPVLPDDGHTYS